MNSEVGMCYDYVEQEEEQIDLQPEGTEIEAFYQDVVLEGLIRVRGGNPQKIVRTYLDSNGKPYSVEVKYVVIHATASHQTFTAQGLQAWFLRPKAQDGLGWSRGGYHVMIEPSGKVVRHYPNETHTNGVLAYFRNGLAINNQNSIHISWIGGIDKNLQPLDNRTEAQKKSLKAVIQWCIENGVELVFLGHNQCENKPCPVFNHVDWLRENFPQLPEKLIYSADNFGYLGKMTKPVFSPAEMAEMDRFEKTLARFRKTTPERKHLELDALSLIFTNLINTLENGKNEI